MAFLLIFVSKTKTVTFLKLILNFLHYVEHSHLCVTKFIFFSVWFWEQSFSKFLFTGHMTMMHSRNSCKTLKCPKCNWHYKYQETLEIHMKEKHPETDQTCIYCVTKQSHPRLARGESYMCGYKPYR